MQKIICNICKNSSLSELNGVKGYNYCDNCKVAWMKKFPKAKYDEEYYKGKSGIAQKIFKPVAEFLYAIRRSYVDFSKIKSWIDVGAGEGGFLRTVRAKKRIGVEVSKIGREMMNNLGIDSMKNTDFLKSKGLDADVISFWHVLEHLETPWAYLASAKRNISKKGVLVIGVPNIDSLEFKYFKKHWFHLAPKYHLWQFSPESMKRMLNNEGFEVRSIDYWSPEHQISGLLQSLINKCSRTDAVLHKLVKRELEKEKLPLKGLLWTMFWTTIGLPVVLIIWVINSLAQRSGTFVVIASLK